MVSAKRLTCNARETLVLRGRRVGADLRQASLAPPLGELELSPAPLVEPAPALPPRRDEPAVAPAPAAAAAPPAPRALPLPGKARAPRGPRVLPRRPSSPQRRKPLRAKLARAAPARRRGRSSAAPVRRAPPTPTREVAQHGDHVAENAEQLDAGRRSGEAALAKPGARGVEGGALVTRGLGASGHANPAMNTHAHTVPGSLQATPLSHARPLSALLQALADAGSWSARACAR